MLLLVVLHTVALVEIGTLFAAIAARLGRGEALLATLLLPAVTPVFLSAVLSTQRVLAGDGLAPAARPWLLVTAGLDVLYFFVAMLTFEFVLDDKMSALLAPLGAAGAAHGGGALPHLPVRTRGAGDGRGAARLLLPRARGHGRLSPHLRPAAGLGWVPWTGRRGFDYLAIAATELAFVFCTLVLVTGPIWAKPAWGTWWTWEAKLTTTLVLWLLLAASLMVRGQAENREQGRASAPSSVWWPRSMCRSSTRRPLVAAGSTPWSSARCKRDTLDPGCASPSLSPWERSSCCTACCCCCAIA